MALVVGSRLGPYEILDRLGAGGMGEVYKARDTRLDRTVAIRVLPSHLSSNPDLRARFEREARAASALNHPHICTLHDIGQQDGIDYLVLEHLEGETLADRLAKGPLPIDGVLRFGMEIAGALGAAHKAGIVHRDLKPGNVMVTKAGAKLLDFGLAKLRALGETGEALSSLHTATAAKPLTSAGRSWERSSTWRPSRWRAARPMPGPMSGHWAHCSTRWRRDGRRSRERARPA